MIRWTATWWAATGSRPSPSGYRYLTVDASTDSEPILGRLGFRRLARTTPYTWRPRTAPPPGQAAS